MPDLRHEDVTLSITTGGGISFGITNKDTLVVFYDGQATGAIDIKLNLGICTRRRIEQLQDHLERLKAHAVE